jgi:hypothetical protein
MGKEKTSLGVESPAVLTHIASIQAVITRMAGSSASMKTWCATLVGATAVLDHLAGWKVLVVIVPIAVIAILDSYYLAMERDFRRAYNKFVKRLHRQQLEESELFVIRSKSVGVKDLFDTFTSKSVWPFYLLLVGMVIGISFIPGGN